MAFDPQDLSDVKGLNKGRTLWHYQTNDSMATVLGAGYFNAAEKTLRAGDAIIVTAGDGEATVRVPIVHGGVVAVAQGGANTPLPPDALAPGSVARSVVEKLGEGASLADFSTLADGFAVRDDLSVSSGSYSLSSLSVPGGKTLLLRRGATLQTSGTAISVLGRISAPDAVFGPTGACGAIGDSRAGGANWAGYPGSSVKNFGCIWTCAELRSKGALHFSLRHLKAAGGSTTADLDGQLTTLLAEPDLPRYCYILSGTNDDTNVTAAEQVRRIVNVWLRLLSRGIVPIHIPDLPRVVSTYTAARTSRNRVANRTLRGLADNMGVVFIDPTSLLTDYSNNNGDRNSTYYTDEVHENLAGCYAIGDFIATRAIARGLVVPSLGSYASASAADNYHATDNPGGNWWTNARFIGTGGSKGTGVTGNAPTGYTVTRNSGSDSGASDVVAREDGQPGNWWQMTVSEAAATCEFIMQNNFAVPVGVSIVFACDVDVSGVTGRASAAMQLNQNGVASTTLMNIGDIPTGGSIGGDPLAAYSGRYLSGPYVVQTGCTSVRTRMSAKFVTGASGVIRFGNPYFAIIS